MKTITYFFAVLFICCFTSLKTYSQSKTEIKGQDSRFRLYTRLDSSNLSRYSHIFSSFSVKNESLDSLRKFLTPYFKANDPLATLLLAKTYDLRMYGIKSNENDSLALMYYNKASELNLAKAEYFLYKAYRYNYLNLKKSPETALLHLKRAAELGDSATKSMCYLELGRIFFNGKNLSVIPDTTKAIFFVEKSLEYSPNDMSATDFLAYLYQLKGNYNSAKNLMLRSSNEQSRLQAALWMIKGDKVNKETKKGIAIIFEEARKLKEKSLSVHSYMGSINPVYVLNDLYHENLISKKELGNYFLENYRPGKR